MANPVDFHKNLPIHELESAIVRELSSGVRLPRLIVKAPTGSGKSTRIPQMIQDRVLRGEGQVVILQPRRIAARMLARRVAFERASVVGDEVGYQVRFENVVGPKTRIRYVTEGILLREMISNPRLDGIAAVVFDEFHERHLYGDLTLGHCLGLQESIRPDLRIVVMSATVDTAAVESFLKPCTTLVSEGRMYPVNIEYLPQSMDFDKTPVWSVAARAVESLASSVGGGILVFMPGSYEISRTVELLKESPKLRGREVYPLHAELPPEAQDRAVSPSEQGHIIVATNVAESSLTIEGIGAVVDSGLARIARHDPYRGINTLLVQKISQASADQRAGRAGRTGPGRCIRLWSEKEHRERPRQETPEVRRLELAEAALTLKGLGIRTLSEFRWIEPPDPLALERAETLLRDLGAADERGAITDLGRRMLRFPVHPRFSRMLIAAASFSCVREAALIAAIAQGRPLLIRRADSGVKDRREDALTENDRSDFFVLMEAYRHARENRFRPDVCQRLGIHGGAARQVEGLYDSFMRLADQAGLQETGETPHEEDIRRCILLGFSDHLALRRDLGTLGCDLVHSRVGELSRESVIRRHPLFVAAAATELDRRVAGRKTLNVVLDQATAVEPEWLDELFPGEMKNVAETLYDPELKRVVLRRRKEFRGLALEARDDLHPPEHEAAQALAAEVEAGRIRLSEWNDAVEHWITRVNCLAAWRPDWEVPKIDSEARRMILEQICLGARSARELKDRPVLPVVRSWLTPAQQDRVDRHAPERLMLPTGRRGRIEYEDGRSPRLSALIQDLFDLKEPPSVAGGRVRVLVEILAPNRRPVQVTDDLPSFWREIYPKIKPQLARRYPRHVWR